MWWTCSTNLGIWVGFSMKLKDNTRSSERLSIPYSGCVEFLIQRRENRPKMRITLSFILDLGLMIDRRILRKMMMGPM